MHQNLGPLDGPAIFIAVVPMRSQSVEVLLVPEGEKDLLRNLMQAYRHDLSEFTGEAPNEWGEFGVGNYFDVYWLEPERYPFKVLVSGEVAGFALVRELEPDVHSIAEFFILRRHRRSGVGREAAFLLFDQFPGSWHVAQDRHNVPAQRFWRRVIAEYSENSFEETLSESQPVGPQQTFMTRPDSSAAGGARPRGRAT